MPGFNSRQGHSHSPRISLSGGFFVAPSAGDNPQLRETARGDATQQPSSRARGGARSPRVSSLPTLGGAAPPSSDAQQRRAVTTGAQPAGKRGPRGRACRANQIVTPQPPRVSGCCGVPVHTRCGGSARLSNGPTRPRPGARGSARQPLQGHRLRNHPLPFFRVTSNLFFGPGSRRTKLGGIGSPCYPVGAW